MTRNIWILSVLISIILACSRDSLDDNARAMGGSYSAILTKYQKLLQNAENDSAYRSLRENRRQDLQMLLEKYSDEPSTDALELIRAQVFYDLDEYDSALEKLNKLIEDDSRFKNFARFQKVRILQEKNQMAEALEIFRDVEDDIEVNDQYIDVLMDFAYSVPEIKIQEHYTRKLLKINKWPQNDLIYRAYMFRNLALIQKQQNNIQQAVRTLERGITELQDTVNVNSLQSTLELIGMIGKEAPPLSAETWLNSRPAQIKDLKGKVILIDFWAPWCSPCRVVIPTLVDEYQKKKDKGLVILGYTRLYGTYRDDIQRVGKVEPKDEIRYIADFLKRYNMTYPVAIDHDKEGFETYFIQGIPTLIFIDKEGKIADFKIGSGNEHSIRDRIDELL